MATTPHCRAFSSEHRSDVFPHKAHHPDTPDHQEPPSLLDELDTLLENLSWLDNELRTIGQLLQDFIRSRQAHGQPLSINTLSAAVLIGLASDIHRLEQQFTELKYRHRRRLTQARDGLARVQTLTKDTH